MHDLTPETLAELRRLHGALTPFALRFLSNGPGGEPFIALACEDGSTPLPEPAFDAVLLFAELAAAELPTLLDAAAERDALAAKVARARTLLAEWEARADFTSASLDKHPDDFWHGMVTKGRECISDLRRAIAGSEGANGPQNDERIADDPPPERRMCYILMSRMDGKPRTSAFTSLYDAQHRMRFYDPEEVAVMRRMSEDEPWEEVR